MATAGRTALQINCLGRTQIRYEGEALAPAMLRKAQALLIYLGLEPGRHQRDSLAALLWSEMPEDRARANLRTALSRMPEPLGPYLKVSYQSVAFDPAPGSWIDVVEFEQRLTSDSLPARREALTLYRGDFLDGFVLRNASLFEEWALLRREHLRSLALDGLSELAEASLAQGDHTQAIVDLRRLLALDPWREAAHRSLIGALAASGDRAAALAQFEACRQTLADDLGVEPATATVTLYEEIWSGAWQEEKGARDSPPHNLPAPVTPLLGRERELKELDRLLADADRRLITIVGPGGVGKTRLALRAATTQLERFPQGVFLVSLASVRQPENITAAIADAVNHQFSGQEAPQRQLLNYLRGKRILLLMDNFEHLLPGAGIVSNILRHAPQVNVLATSREKLNLRGETTLALDGMAFPERETAPDVLQYDVIRLFVERARRASPGFRAAAQDGQHVARICRLVEGLPLAIELAAAWVKVLSPAEIAAEIERDVDFLAGETRDAPRRQRSMGAVFDHSWNLLQETEQEVFKKLAVFEGGFSRKAAQEIADASLAQLMALANKSLIYRRGPRRYGIHELLRQFAQKKLAQSPALHDDVRNRHCAYFAAFLQQQEAALWGGEQEIVRPDIDNVRAAWHWAIANECIANVQQALYGLFAIYEFRGWYHEGEAMFRSAAMRLRTARPTGEKGIAYGRVLVQLGGFAYRVAKPDEARQYLHQGQEILRALDAQPELAWANVWSVWAGVPANDKEAEALLRESQALLRDSDSQWGLDLTLLNLGFLAQDLGRYRQAEKYMRQSLHVARAANDRRGIAWALHGLGEVAWTQAQFVAARNYFEESLDIMRTLGYQWSIGNGLRSLGKTVIKMEDYQAAQAFFTEARDLYTDIGDTRGFLDASLGQTLAALAMGALAEAEDHYRRALAGLRGMGDDEKVADYMRDFALQLTAVTDEATAKGYYAQALQRGIESGALASYGSALVGMAAVVAAEGEPERGVEIAALAQRRAACDEATMTYANELLGELQPKLSPEQFTAARERGREQDLAATVQALLEASVQLRSGDA